MGRCGEQWSSEEVEYLKENYGQYTAKFIGKQLGRSEYSVQIKASKIGINKREYNQWTTGEILYVKEHYANTNTYLLAAELEKTPRSVWDCASRLGIHKKKRSTPKQCQPQRIPRKPKWTEWEDNFLRETYDILHWTQMQKRGLNRSRYAIMNRISTLGLSGNHVKCSKSKGAASSFFYRNDEELQRKREYMNFWEEVCKDEYDRARRAGENISSGIKGI